MPTSTAKLLDSELEQLRQDRDFMLSNLRTRSLSNFLGLGFYSAGVWKKYPPASPKLSHKYNRVIVTEEETFEAAGMRCMLLGLFWKMQARPPQSKVSMDDIGDEAFWLEFLRIGQANNWQAKNVQQAILDSESPQIPPKVRVAAWLFIAGRCHLAGNYGTRLPAAAFERLGHIEFSWQQKERWKLLLGFGLESMFKKQQFRTNMAMDMSAATMPDWFSFALAKRRSDIVCHWLQEHPAESLGISLSDIMLYVAANYHGEYAVKVIECLEQLSPGLCAGFCDQHGNNLLWYTASCWQLRSQFASTFDTDRKRRNPNSAPCEADEAWRRLAHVHGDQNGRTAGNWKLLECLIKLGISADQPNHYGFKFRDLDEFGQMIKRRWQITRLRDKDPQLPATC